MLERIHRKRERGWKMLRSAVYVGRPTKWGNPRVGRGVIEAYRRDLFVGRLPVSIDEVISEPAGRDLAC